MAVIALASLGSCHRNNNTPATPLLLTLTELEHFNKDCNKAKEQLEQLYYIQNIKSFAEDPDELSDDDRTYNRLLKDTIWWYTYTCGNQL